MANMHMPIKSAQLRIKRVLREKWGLISWLAIPVIIVFLMSLISGSGGGQLTGKLLVTDQDQSSVSQFVTGAFNQGPLAEIFTVTEVTPEEGRLLMDAGEASAWVTLEQGFGDALLDNLPSSIQLVKNPAQSILPQLVESSLQLLVDAVGYVQVLFDKELAILKPMLTNQKFNDAELVMLTLGIKSQMERLESALMPPQIKMVEQAVESAEAAEQKITFGLLMFPGAIFMALIFCANSLTVSMWDDAKQGVIPRLASTPAALGAYFNGQVLAAVVILGLLALFLGTLGGWYFGLPWMKLPLTMVWLVFSGLVIWQLFATIALLMPSGKVANITINAMLFPLLMLGGSFFPMESMPAWLAKVGTFLPNGFLLKGLKDWLVRSEPWLDALMWPMLLGLVMLLVLWILNHQLIKKLVYKV